MNVIMSTLQQDKCQHNKSPFIGRVTGVRAHMVNADLFFLMHGLK